MKRRHVAMCFSLAAASCASFQTDGPGSSARSPSAPVMQDDGAAAAPEQASARVKDTHPACPSQDFGKFLQAFASHADAQRQFTKLPLEYGQVDVDAIATRKEVYSLRTIKTFEKIPSFDARSGGIIPNERRRTKEHERLEVQTTPEDPEFPRERKARDDKVATLFIDDTGFHVYYRFQWTDGCWFLRAIHDKST